MAGARPNSNPLNSETAGIESSLAKADDRVAVLRDLLWALVNAKEFLFNH